MSPFQQFAPRRRCSRAYTARSWWLERLKAMIPWVRSVSATPVAAVLVACSVPKHVESAPAQPETFVCTVLVADSLGFVIYESDSARAEFEAVRETPGQDPTSERAYHDLIEIRVRDSDVDAKLRIRVWSALFWRRPLAAVSTGGSGFVVGTVETKEERATDAGVRAAREILDRCSEAAPADTLATEQVVS